MTVMAFGEIVFWMPFALWGGWAVGDVMVKTRGWYW